MPDPPAVASSARGSCKASSGAIEKASGNDASLLETEIAASTRSRSADNDVIQQLELQDSAGFENSPGKAHIGLGRGGVTRRVVVYHDEGISGVGDHRLKDFSWMGQRLIDAALADRADLD